MRFIKEKDVVNLREITSLNLLSEKNKSFDLNGIFSPSIFGSQDYSCECGSLQGAWHTGTICPKCNTTIIDPKDNIYRYGKFKIPRGFKIFNTVIYQIMCKNIKGFENMIKPQSKHIDIDGNIIYNEDNENRCIDFTEFTFNYESAVNAVLPDGTVKFDEKLKKLKSFLLANEDVVMTDSIIILPLHLRPTQFSISEKVMLTQPLNKCYNSINTHIHSIINNVDEKDIMGVEHELFEIQRCMTDLYNQITEIIAYKEGLARDQILSNKINFSGRAVISVKHDNDPTSVSLPKIIFTEIYMPKILTYIVEHMKLSYTDATEYYYMNRFDYDNKIINDAIDEILLTKPIVLLNRNPSLHLLSIQAFYVSEVTNDYTIKLAKPVLQSFNADFDSDFIVIIKNITYY